MTATIYRIQHQKTGLGPYNPGDISNKERDLVNEAHERLNQIRYHDDLTPEYRDPHPCPASDGIDAPLIAGSVYQCGFESLDALRDWFPTDVLNMLRRAHFDIVEISLDADEDGNWYDPEQQGEYQSLWRGRRQVVFDKDAVLATTPLH